MHLHNHNKLLLKETLVGITLINKLNNLLYNLNKIRMSGVGIITQQINKPPNRFSNSLHNRFSNNLKLNKLIGILVVKLLLQIKHFNKFSSPLFNKQYNRPHNLISSNNHLFKIISIRLHSSHNRTYFNNNLNRTHFRHSNNNSRTHFRLNNLNKM